MADTLKNKTISKNHSGFPAYLDFEKLRSSAIAYLGQLSGNIWTDHNVHDPGITILEMLIYAMLDLGYRTNLPPIDLFTRNPEDKSKDNNFFTASQILANNPLTITDFRKLLVDLDGVKNAWLEIETGNLNGLYRVYVQLEDGIADKRHHVDKILRKIKHTLLSHRNICEDFVDIQVLCTLDLGLCAEIELDGNADPEEVYLKMVSTLRDFFSPAPRFYSLQQLLEKQIPIEEIFAGRPFNVTESHGFIDTAEFEQLNLRKELHLTDVYHAIFDLEGVKDVRNLGWIKCCGEMSVQDWKLILPENHIPVFSAKCSGFTFTRKGSTLKVDVNKFATLVDMKFSGRQKALYKEPSPFLDAEVPNGIYHSDLADYYSIQNEFPRVYGINEGGLDNKSPEKRKAQALQLQGFLLFFDQLLANYLTQLKNIRSLFSLSSAKKDEDRHTYFINQLSNAPQLQKLIRFDAGPKSDASLGSEGSILAYPTSRKKIQDLLENNDLKSTGLDLNCRDDREDFPPYHFCFAAERDQAVNQLRDDLLMGDYEPVIASNDNDCYFFYLFTSSPDFAIIGKHNYKNAREAADAAASVKYTATFSENYRSFIQPAAGTGDVFSFDIELNLNAYAKYLQLIVEDKDLYLKRRQDFQQHLLSRFAERFTDYALLTSGFLPEQDLKLSQIKARELFLSHYDDISSNRGKGYDYAKNKWGKNNISGFEKRFKALSGIENWRKHFLCNFTVEKADKQFKLSIELFDTVFEVEDKILNEGQAMAALKSVYKKLANPVFESVYVPHEKLWKITIQDEYGNKFASRQLFPDKEKAGAFSKLLTSMSHFKPDFSSDIQVTRNVYKTYVTDHKASLIAESREHFVEKKDADEFSTKAGNRLSFYLKDKKTFTLHNGKKLDKLLSVSKQKFPYTFIDEHKFDFKPYDVIHLKKEKKKFSAINKIGSIQFDSLVEYDTVKLAREGFRKLLVLLASKSNYAVTGNKNEDEFKIIIGRKAQKLAAYYESFESPLAAQQKLNEIIHEINSYTYNFFTSEPVPFEWEFIYRSLDLSGREYKYISQGQYNSENKVRQAASYFYSNIPRATIKVRNNILYLAHEKQELISQSKQPVESIDPKEVNEAKKILKHSLDLYKNINEPSQKDFNSILEKSRINPGEDFVYKLVDKDNLMAVHPSASIIPDEASAEKIKNALINNAQAGYNFIEINLSGDAIRERKDSSKKTKWYHYTIQCINRKFNKGDHAGNELVLFESTKGYAKKEEALKALLENYLLILRYARQEKNYGSWISLKKILIHSEDPNDISRSIVFVPAETQYEFDGIDVIPNLVALAGSYPVRYIRKNKYQFVTGNVDEASGSFTMDWRSKATWRTATEAMYRFRFFLVLLKYPGNFYTEWSQTNCSFHVYIREVLAISAHGFSNPADAWGPLGIEKFICTTQSKEGFHPYLNRIDCSDSFYVACGNTGLVHPCTYDTPRRRDAVLDKLYKASDFNFFSLINSVDKKFIVLNNMRNEPVVKINTDKQRGFNFSPCEWLIKFIEAVGDDNNYVKSGKGFHLNCRLTVQNREVLYPIAEPYSATIKLKDWKEQLQKIACYFPVHEEAISCDTDEITKYFVRIKLPGFDRCEDDISTDRLCDPNGIESGCEDSCHVAWESNCCFDTCFDALKFYAHSFALLTVYENYKPVFDCLCGSYRIELHPRLSLRGKQVLDEKSRELAAAVNMICAENENDDAARAGTRREGVRNTQFCFSEIVAINPQAYTNEKMACDAVERSKKLINSEGLHLVEHILLRDRCTGQNESPYDAECKRILRSCVNVDEVCKLTWIPGGEGDGCIDAENDRFIPGFDPFSFISTLALPAWPERFRSRESRRNIERLLQREAPAHVLLRILWLNPSDLNRFEHYFKAWNEWLARKIGDKNYSNCEFLRFLFKTRFDDTGICNECQPCLCRNEKPVSCFGEQDVDVCSGFDLTDTINELYCWAPEKGIYQEPKEKIKLFRARSHTYENNIHEIALANPENKTAANALIFLKKTTPVPGEFSSLIAEILNTKIGKAKTNQGLNQAEKKILIQNTVWKYLDLVCFNQEGSDKITSLRDVFALMRKNKTDMDALFEAWNIKQIRQYEQAIDFEKIRDTMKGSQKDHATHNK